MSLTEVEERKIYILKVNKSVPKSVNGDSSVMWLGGIAKLSGM
jgi:hypothetical protein